MSSYQLPPGSQPPRRLTGPNPVWNAVQPVQPMAQPPVYPPYGNMPAGPGDTTPGYAQTLWRYKWSVLLLAVIGGALGVAWSRSQPKIYTARTSIEIQGLNENFLNMREIDPNAVNYGSDSYMQTQIKILQSNSLLTRVVDRLRSDRGVELRVAPTWRDHWDRLLGKPVEPPPVANSREALQIARGNMRVRGSGLTRIVELEFDDPSPELAAEFVNTLAFEFMDENLEARLTTSQRTGEWLEQRRRDLKRRLELAEERLLLYARGANLLYTANNDNLAEEKLRQLQTELSEAQAARISKQSLYEMAVSGPVDQLPVNLVEGDGAVGQMQTKLAEMRAEEARLLATLTPLHPTVVKKREEIAAQVAALEKERQDIVQRVRADYRAAQRREDLLTSAYAGQTSLVTEQAEKGIQYQILKREVDTTRSLYEAMLEKVNDAGISSALSARSARVVDEAMVPYVPTRPSQTQNGILGLFGGLFCGTILAFVRAQFSERNLGYAGKNTTTTLALPELGVIPSARVEKAVTLAPKRDVILGGTVQSDTSLVGKLSFRMLGGQKGLAALKDTFQSTLTSVLFSADGGPQLRVLVLASPRAQEGKTTAVSNLALAWAEIGKRVLVIDGDVRRARAHQLFNLDNERGLTNLLVEQTPIDEYAIDALARKTSVAGVDMITAGPPVPNISALLHSPRLAALIERMSREYDVVLIDTPPLLELPDARIFGKLADAVILVFRSRKTPQALAIAARDRLLEDGIPVLGTILNDWKPPAGSSKYSYSYRYTRD